MIRVLLTTLLILFTGVATLSYFQPTYIAAFSAVNNNGKGFGHKKPTPTPTITPTPTLSPTATPTPTTAPTLTPTPTPTTVPMSIQLTSPNGGEILQSGQVYRITWNSSPQIDMVTLGYKACDSCLDWIAYNIPNQGYFDWTVKVAYPNVTQFKIEIIGYDTGVGSMIDLSDNHFTVPAPAPSPTPSPTPTPTTTPSPTSGPLGITSVITRPCTIGSSCHPYITNIEVNGYGFASDSRIKLTQTTPNYIVINGYYYVGGDGSAKILTDFYDLPRCYQYNVTVYGSTGTVTAPNTISSLCP